MQYQTPADATPTRRSIDEVLAPQYVDLLHVRFPQVRAIADELLGRSQVFRDLVEQYGMCADALDHLSKRVGGMPLALEHYTSLRFDLEIMLLRYMFDHGHSAERCWR